MIELRDYQRAAIDALYAWFRAGRGSPLVVAPTGSGKSVILAEFARSAVVAYPETRILIVTHVRELIAQNHAALIRLWPDAPAGIYSAGLGKRQLGRQVLVAGVQSVARRARDLGHVDLAIVDEAHLVPRSSDTQYGRLFEGLRATNPNLKVIGLTATPYRLDSGLLHGGENALFDGIAYDIPIGMLVERGHLAPLDLQAPGRGVRHRRAAPPHGRVRRARDAGPLRRRRHPRRRRRDRRARPRPALLDRLLHLGRARAGGARRAARPRHRRRDGDRRDARARARPVPARLPGGPGAGADQRRAC